MTWRPKIELTCGMLIPATKRQLFSRMLSSLRKLHDLAALNLTKITDMLISTAANDYLVAAIKEALRCSLEPIVLFYERTS